MRQNFKGDKRRKEEMRKKKQEEKRNKRLNKKEQTPLADPANSVVGTASADAPVAPNP